jgi:quercetin dioxygenase-like cupin family protein
MARSHQPDESVFKAILPEDIEWEPFPAFPASARLAIVVGEPTKPGPYVIRVKVPSGVKLMPHRHPEDRIYTVMSGVFYIGLGDKFDGDKVTAYPPGSVIVLPGDTWHFHWAKSGEYVTRPVRSVRWASNTMIPTTIRATRTTGTQRLQAPESNSREFVARQVEPIRLLGVQAVR